MLKLIKIKYKKFPKLVEAVENRHKVYNKTLAYIRKLETDGKIMVIRPTEKVQIGRLEKDKEKLKTLYSKGYSECMKNMTRLKAYLEN